MAERLATAALLLLLAACSSPRWIVGECLELDLLREGQQQPEIVRIYEVGPIAYLVRRWVAGAWASYTIERRDRLDHPSYWKPVICPTEATMLDAPPISTPPAFRRVPIVTVESLAVDSLMRSQLEQIGPKAEAHLRTIIYEECARSRESRGATP